MAPHFPLPVPSGCWLIHRAVVLSFSNPIRITWVIYLKLHSAYPLRFSVGRSGVRSGHLNVLASISIGSTAKHNLKIKQIRGSISIRERCTRQPLCDKSYYKVFTNRFRHTAVVNSVAKWVSSFLIHSESYFDDPLP